MRKHIVKMRGFEVVAKEHLKSYKTQDDVVMPLRGTKYSAGYDFFLPTTVEIPSQTGILIWSDIKVYMLDNEVFEIFPRSSIAIKRNIRIKNIIGIIDSDYYSNPKNDGNIGIFLWNFGGDTQQLKGGEAVAQGVFKKFLEAYNCNTDEIRVGGIGSTNKNN